MPNFTKQPNTLKPQNTTQSPHTQQTCAYIHTYMHTCLHTYIHTCIYIYTHTHIPIYIYAHMYKHKLIYCMNCICWICCIYCMYYTLHRHTTYIYIYRHAFILKNRHNSHRHSPPVPSSTSEIRKQGLFLHRDSSDGTFPRRPRYSSVGFRN